MKILHVTPILGPANGGSAIMPLNLAREQARSGNNVTVITSDFQLDPSILAPQEMLEIISFECLRLFNFMFITPMMDEWLRLNMSRFDIVHLHNCRSYQSILVAKYARQFNVPYVLQAHGSAKIVGGKEHLKRMFDRVWGRRIVRGAVAHIAVSKREIEHYLKLGAPQHAVHIIPNAIDFDTRHRGYKKGAFRKDFGISSDTDVVLFVGRLNRIKCVDILIRAFAQLIEQRNNVVLVIVGPDDGAEISLRHLVRALNLDDVVKFIGLMSDPGPAYADANVLAYPSQYEIFGLVPLEAICHGIPVVVSSENGCGDIISEASCGLIVPPDDASALSEAIEYLLDHPSDGQEMVNNGKCYIERKLNWTTITGQIDHAYESFVNSKNHDSS